MKSAFLAWQDPRTRMWTPVGRLSTHSGYFRFNWTRGAQEFLGVLPLPEDMKDISVVYESTQLFPFFSNRLLKQNRPEFKRYIRWAALEGQEADPIAAIAMTGGERATDSFEVFPEPERTASGEYEIYFFSRGLKYLPESVDEAVSRLQTGNSLLLMRDIQNIKDSHAIAIRTEDPPQIVGYCPRYYASDISRILDVCSPADAKTRVHRVNLDAPSNFRLLCRFTAPWPEDFRPFSDEAFAPAVPLESARRVISVVVQMSARASANALAVTTNIEDR